MSTGVPPSIIDRLRANLAAAGIAPSEEDFAAVIDGPFLQAVVAFEEKCAGWSVPDDVLPDYLIGMTAPPPDGNDRSTPIDVGGERPPVGRAGTGHDTIFDVAPRVRSGEISPIELVERALARISDLDPEINAFHQVHADRALEAARQAEREIGNGDYRGPLHGIPIAIKDLIGERGLINGAGSRVLDDTVAASDAAAVERLRAAGAILIGRTRMSEFAYLPGSSNGHYGPTRNPGDPTRDAGGSSGGSAAAVATGMAFAALGTDTGGSIRIPAAFCGVVGFKPTFGGASLHGTVPLAWSLDHLGPLARTVSDAALLAGVLAGEDPRDGRTRPGTGFSGYPLRHADPRHLRVAVPSGPIRERLGVPEVWAVVERALGALEAAGAAVVPVDIPELEELWILNNTILAVEAGTFHAPWLRTRLELYGDILRQRLLAGFAHGPDTLVRAQRQRRVLRDQVERRMERFDLLALPTQPDGAPPLDRPGWTLNTAPFNLLGWPALTVPAGATAAGLPIGLQLVGKPWEDLRVLEAGATLESVSR
ncbi:MAG TPA: amidase [Longimicrobiales bacterium]|nr:amidase [Longimicrobiales bacterium]